MKISFVVPTYNSSKYIKTTLNSIIKLKAYDDIEIIVVDDGSTDDTVKILKSYSFKDEILLICNAHHGVSHSRNTALKKASGDYITFVYADDGIVPEGYHKLISYLKENRDIDVLSGSKNVKYHNNYKCINNGDILDLIKCTFRVDQCIIDYSEYRPSVWEKFYSRDVILNNNIHFPEDLYIGEDTFFNNYFLEKSKRVVLVKSNYYLYRNNANSLVHNKEDYKLVKNNNVFKKRTCLLINRTNMKNKNNIINCIYLRSTLNLFENLYGSIPISKLYSEKKSQLQLVSKIMSDSKNAELVNKSFSRSQLMMINSLNSNNVYLSLIKFKFIVLLKHIKDSIKKNNNDSPFIKE